MAPDLVGKQLEFLGTLAGGLLAAPLVAAAQPPRMAGVSCVRSLP
jgi:hypothetical protein